MVFRAIAHAVLDLVRYTHSGKMAFIPRKSHWKATTKLKKKRGKKHEVGGGQLGQGQERIRRAEIQLVQASYSHWKATTKLKNKREKSVRWAASQL